MRWASAISHSPAVARAVEECVAAVSAQLLGAAPDLVFLFTSAYHRESYAALPGLVAPRFPRARLLGCSGTGVIGAGREAERGPVISITAASLPAVEITTSRFDEEPPALPQLTEGIVLLCDPFTIEADLLVNALDEAYPKARKIGGLASGGANPGDSALFLGGEMFTDGAVGVALSGDIAVDTIVAQGCRPIGRPVPIGRCERNLIFELGGRSPVDVMRELYAGLEPRDKELFRGALHVGLEMREGELEYREGDLLVRNLIGVDPNSGAIAIGAAPRPWQVMQFMVRDAQTAEEELTGLLEHYPHRPAGALLFSCVGRGEGLFGVTDHDSALFRKRLGDVPLGGFFCNGEIGPVGGTTFLHGYTSSFGLFRSKSS